MGPIKVFSVGNVTPAKKIPLTYRYKRAVFATAQKSIMEHSSMPYNIFSNFTQPKQ